ncbi:hypothetical protein CVT26_015232 [Gymnopilus dilepis]|uniref:Uncharacterized protein n=1 Tax=Gymnopilus dilepis TaxID=231916 RepID=A0A409W458_9AGAR|nr:hypothetical protein CVT26_015232 [Gymnopilus dilepis]
MAVNTHGHMQQGNSSGPSVEIVPLCKERKVQALLSRLGVGLRHLHRTALTSGGYTVVPHGRISTSSSVSVEIFQYFMTTTTTTTLCGFCRISDNSTHPAPYLVPLHLSKGSDKNGRHGSQKFPSEVWPSKALKTTLITTHLKKKKTKPFRPGNKLLDHLIAKDPSFARNNSPTTIEDHPLHEDDAATLDGPALSATSSNTTEEESSVDVDRSDPITVDEMLAERALTLSQYSRLVDSAQESMALQELREARLLKEMSVMDTSLSELDPSTAAHLAIVARDALAAAERLAVAKVLEAKERLEALKDELELAHQRVTQAETQVVVVLDTLSAQEIPISPMPDLVPGLLDPFPPSLKITSFDVRHVMEEVSEDEGRRVMQIGSLPTQEPGEA